MPDFGLEAVNPLDHSHALGTVTGAREGDQYSHVLHIALGRQQQIGGGHGHGARPCGCHYSRRIG